MNRNVVSIFYNKITYIVKYDHFILTGEFEKD